MVQPLEAVAEERLVDDLVEAPARLGIAHRQHEPAAAAAKVEAGLVLEHHRQLVAADRARPVARSCRQSGRTGSSTPRAPATCGRPRARRRSRTCRPRASWRPCPRAPPPRASVARRTSSRVTAGGSAVPSVVADDGAEHVVGAQAVDVRRVDRSTGTPSSSWISRRSSSAARPCFGRCQEQVADLVEERRPELLEEADARLREPHLRGGRELLAHAPIAFAVAPPATRPAIREDDLSRAERRQVVRDRGAGGARLRLRRFEPRVQLALLVVAQPAQRCAHVLAHGHPAAAEDVLRRGLEREPVHRRRSAPTSPSPSRMSATTRSGNTEPSPETAPTAPRSMPSARAPPPRRRRRAPRAGTARPRRRACRRPSVPRSSARARAGAR